MATKQKIVWESVKKTITMGSKEDFDIKQQAQDVEISGYVAGMANDLGWFTKTAHAEIKNAQTGVTEFQRSKAGRGKRKFNTTNELQPGKYIMSVWSDGKYTSGRLTVKYKKPYRKTVEVEEEKPKSSQNGNGREDREDEVSSAEVQNSSRVTEIDFELPEMKKEYIYIVAGIIILFLITK